MNLNIVNIQLGELLEEFNAKDLPNYPNIKGAFNQTSVTFAIADGERTDNTRVGFITININVSIAAELRKDDESEKVNLYGLMDAVTNKLENKKIKYGGRLELQNFENFTPDSGMWRSLLVFSVDIPIMTGTYEECEFKLAS